MEMTFSYLNAVMQVGLEHFAENNLSEPKAQTSCWLLQPLQIRGKLEGFERNEKPWRDLEANSPCAKPVSLHGILPASLLFGKVS